MKNCTIIIVAVLLFLLVPRRSRADIDTPDWWKVQQDVAASLIEKDASISEHAATLLATKPQTAEDALFRTIIFLRAGMNAETAEALLNLKVLCPDMKNHLIEALYHNATGLMAWDTAKQIVDTFSDHISELWLLYVLEDHLIESGWSIEQVDEWLAGMPEGGQNFWIKERLRFNVSRERGDALMHQLTQAVRNNPGDMEGAIAYLDALIYVRMRTSFEPGKQAWMADLLETEKATDAREMASRLERLLDWSTAIHFYRIALETDLTDEETEQLETMCSIPMNAEEIRISFAITVRESMAACLLKLDRNDEAQHWMLEAADMRKAHDFGLNALLAGQTQRASGARTIEGRIRQEEKKSKDDPEYWMKRARYYRGREESAQEEEALLQGLALTQPQTAPERMYRGSADSRSFILRAYARLLKREERQEEAVALLRQELQQAPPDSPSAEAAADELTDELSEYVCADDPVLWNWLQDRPKWEYLEEDVLSLLLNHSTNDNLHVHLNRAEKLTDRSDPSRAFTLGWIMNRRNMPTQSIPLLKDAIIRAEEDELRQRAQFTLMESYLDLGDWKNADAIFPVADERLSAGEIPRWYGKIAVLAAESGATEDAMRIWDRVFNLCPRDFHYLSDLADAGLSEPLILYYQQVRKQMPTSEVPDLALQILNTP